MKIVVVLQLLLLCKVLNALLLSPVVHKKPPVLQLRQSVAAPEATTQVVSYDVHEHKMTRRHTLLGVVATVCAAFISSPALAVAEETIVQQSTVDEREQRITRMLQNVPTFTIVDAAGIPYMVVGEDAKVTAYFFTSYGEANRILKLARKSVDAGEENPWNQARISSVAMDTAVGLTLKSRDGSLRSYFRVAASASAIDDALSITGDDDLAETKVPLFYTADSPELFFERSQIPKGRGPAQVTELFAILQRMAASDELNDLYIVPPKDSAKKAKECNQKGGSAPPLVLGQSNIIL